MEKYKLWVFVFWINDALERVYIKGYRSSWFRIQNIKGHTSARHTTKYA